MISYLPLELICLIGEQDSYVHGLLATSIPYYGLDSLDRQSIIKDRYTVHNPNDTTYGIKCETWKLLGNLHRENDLPAEIRYYENGEKESEEYWVNGKRHRENDLPAIIRYYENGEKKYESYWIHGKPHRENDLPAEIWYCENGWLL